MSQVALITGGAVRVGRAIALGLAEAGYDIALNYHSSKSDAISACRAIEAMGRRSLAIRGDISNAGDVAAVSGEIRRTFGKLDLLVNNASLFLNKPLLEIDEGEWDRVMAVNLKGPFLMVKETADLLRAGRGRVINLVDLSAFEPWVEHPHHAVSKAGLLHLTRVMAKTMAPHVRVNAIAPGAVLLPDSYDAEARRRSKESAALGTLGSPDDVVRTVLFLERSPFITGEVIVVDGGRHLGG